jgi:hypothetical protein
MWATFDMHGGNETCITCLVVKPETKGPFGKQDVKWKIILKWASEVKGCNFWIGLSQDSNRQLASISKNVWNVLKS